MFVSFCVSTTDPFFNARVNIIIYFCKLDSFGATGEKIYTYETRHFTDLFQILIIILGSLLSKNEN
jgi:hypothetical protein